MEAHYFAAQKNMAFWQFLKKGQSGQFAIYDAVLILSLANGCSSGWRRLVAHKNSQKLDVTLWNLQSSHNQWAETRAEGAVPHPVMRC